MSAPDWTAKVRYRVLGPVPGAVGEDWHGRPALEDPPDGDKPLEDAALTVGKNTLAFLLLACRIGRRVTVREFENVLWPDSGYLPADPRNAVQAAMVAVRKEIKHHLTYVGIGSDGPKAPDIIQQHSYDDTYLLQGELTHVDAHLLSALSVDAQKSLASGDAEGAIKHARAALVFWRGPLFADFSRSGEGAPLVRRFERAHNKAFLVLAEATARTGRPDESVNLIRDRIDQSSGDPELWELLLRALWTTGQKTEARDTIPEAEAAIRQQGHALPDSFQRIRHAIDAANDTELVLGSARPKVIVRTPIREDLPEDSRRALLKVDPNARGDEAFDNLVSGPKPHPNFHIFLVGGVSAAGKDTLVTFAANRVTAANRFEQLRKFTTRPQRGGEPKYSITISGSRFEDLLDDLQLLWPYEKRDQWYAFDCLQVEDAMQFGRRLVAIFTEVDRVPSVLDRFAGKAIPATGVFVDATIEAAYDRSRFMRGFSAEEIITRINSISDDMGRIKRRSSFRDEYVFVQNSNTNALDSAVDSLVEILEGGFE